MKRPSLAPTLALLTTLGGALATPPVTHAAAPSAASYNPDDNSYGFDLLKNLHYTDDESDQNSPSGVNPAGNIVAVTKYLLPPQSPLGLVPKSDAQDVGPSQQDVLFGVTVFGGTNGNGILYAYDTGTQADTILHTFSASDPNTNVNADGAMPIAGLTYDDGVLYGDTDGGGTNGTGTIFSFDLHDNTFSSLFSEEFLPYATAADPIPTNTDGGGLGTKLVLDNGLLYGVAAVGGTGGGGTIFSFDPAAKQFTPLYDFAARSGQSSDLTVGPNGLLYGVYNGQVYSFDPATKTLTSFPQSTSFNNAIYNQRLTLGPNGRLYGTQAEGLNDDALFSFDPATGQYALLHTLPLGQSYQFSPLTLDGGLLVGLEGEAGPNNTGEAFAYDPATDTLTDIHDFAPFDANGNNADGYIQDFTAGSPGALTLGPDGSLYGAAYNAGPGGGGTLFALVPQPNGQAAIPEPSPLALLALGLLPLGRRAIQRRRTG